MGEPIKPKEAAAPSFMETQEFKDAVAAAAEQAATKAAAATIAMLSKAQSSPLDATSLVEQLALAISDLSHQGDPSRKPVDPKVLAERRAATDRMNVLIAEAMALPKGDPRAPKYRTRSKLMFHDTEITPYYRDPGTKKMVPREFWWRSEPNDAMVPVNDFAKRIYAEFRLSRGNRADYDKSVRFQTWVSDKGLIIEGTAPRRREVSEADATSPRLEIGRPDDPNAEFINVLGTSHEPARQNYAGMN